jgi:hypothetical protein
MDELSQEHSSVQSILLGEHCPAGRTELTEENRRFRYLKSEACDEFKASVQRIEDTADLCYKTLTLLNQPKELASWALLARSVLRIEEVIQEKGFGTQSHSIAIQNLGRWSAQVLAWVSLRGNAEFVGKGSLRWSPTLAEPVDSALAAAAGYDAFTSSFPLWHKSVLWAELVEPNCVRLSAEDSDKRRQVRAHQQGICPPGLRPTVGSSLSLSPSVDQEVKQRTANLVQNASGDLLSFSYGKPKNLWKQLYVEYFNLLGTLFRRQDDLRIGTYTLKEFRGMYSALLALCGVHDLACAWRGQMMGQYPINSAVMVFSRKEWITRVQDIASLPQSVVEDVVSDLTFGVTKTLDLFVHPFVPLSKDSEILGLVPQFPLKSRPDENIIRVCSYLRPTLHDALTESKEEEMRNELQVRARKGLKLGGPRPLPGSRDIDLIVEDASDSTLLIAELKWLRKTIRPTEHTSRQEEFLHAVEQVRAIKTFLQANPRYLLDAGEISKSLDDYKKVYFGIVARDYFVWLDPSEFPVIDYDQLLRVIGEPRRLQDAMEELLTFDWLPVQGRDFKVNYDRGTANGVSVETEVNYPTY